MPFSTHPPRFTQLVEFLAPLSAILYLLVSLFTTYRLRSFFSSPSLIIASHTTLTSTQRLLILLTLFPLLSYAHLSSTSHSLSKPVNICVETLDIHDPEAGCHDHFHPQTALLTLQWKLYTISCVCVLGIFAWNGFVMWRVTRAISARAAKLRECVERSLEKSQEVKGRGGEGRESEGWRNWGMGWEDEISDRELVERWIGLSHGRVVLMLAAFLVGGAGWWVLPVGKRELGWWID